MHPKATIFAIAGPIVIGSGCIIEEATIIVNRQVLLTLESVIHFDEYYRRKEVMRIGDENLFEVGCRAYALIHLSHSQLTSVAPGVECPSIGDHNTISARSRVHHTVRISNYCVIGVGCLVVPIEDEILDDFTVVYGPAADRRKWSGRGKVQEADLRRKHADYLREMIPKFNRLRRGDGI